MLYIPKDMVINFKGSDQTVDPEDLRLNFIVFRSEFKVTHYISSFGTLPYQSIRQVKLHNWLTLRAIIIFPFGEDARIFPDHLIFKLKNLTNFIKHSYTRFLSFVAFIVLNDIFEDLLEFGIFVPTDKVGGHEFKVVLALNYSLNYHIEFFVMNFYAFEHLSEVLLIHYLRGLALENWYFMN